MLTALPTMFVHVGTQQQVDRRLIAAPLFLIPFQYIAIDPQSHLLLCARLQAATHKSFCEHLRSDFRHLCEIDVFILHFIETLKVSS